MRSIQRTGRFPCGKGWTYQTTSVSTESPSCAATQGRGRRRLASWSCRDCHRASRAQCRRPWLAVRYTARPSSPCGQLLPCPLCVLPAAAVDCHPAETVPSTLVVWHVACRSQGQGPTPSADRRATELRGRDSTATVRGRFSVAGAVAHQSGPSSAIGWRNRVVGRVASDDARLSWRLGAASAMGRAGARGAISGRNGPALHPSEENVLWDSSARSSLP